MKHPTLHQTGEISWSVLLLLQPFNQFGAMRLLAALVLLLFFVQLAIRKMAFHKWSVPLPTGAVLVGSLLVVWAGIASAIGPYPEDSFNALRQSLLMQTLIFSGGLVFVRSTFDAWRALTVVLAGLVLVTALSSLELGTYWFSQGLSLDMDRGHGRWWGGYGAVGACLSPLLVGWLLLPGRKFSELLGGSLLLIVVCLLVLLYGSRTPVIVMFLGIAVVFVCARRWRLLAGLFATMVVCFVLLSMTSSARLERYETLVKADTYTTNTGLSWRPALWQGMIEVIAKRPLLGYGYGWKKLAWAINDQGFAKLWKAEGGLKADYYLSADGKAAYGRVNPHDYFLQVAFEIGIPGLILAIAFWLAILRESAGLLATTSPIESRSFATAAIGMISAYWISNISNGLWVGGLANLTLSVAACLLAVARLQGIRPLFSTHKKSI